MELSWLWFTEMMLGEGMMRLQGSWVLEFSSVGDLSSVNYEYLLCDV